MKYTDERQLNLVNFVLFFTQQTAISAKMFTIFMYSLICSVKMSYFCLLSTVFIFGTDFYNENLIFVFFDF